MAVLIHRAPEIMAFAADGEKDLIKMPLIARLGPSALQLVGTGLSKLSTPIPHRFIGQGQTALGHQLFDVAVAEAESEVEPNTVANNLCGKPMAPIRVGYGRWVHAASMPHQTAAVQMGKLI